MLAYGQLSIKDREELAQDMCHTVNSLAQRADAHSGTIRMYPATAKVAYLTSAIVTSFISSEART